MTTADDRDDNLTAQEATGIAALMSEPTIEKAAERAGVHERTLRRWITEREPFRRALRREQRAVMASVTSRLQQAAVKAVEALEDVLDDGEAPHASRVTAARAVLEMAREDIQLADLMDRVEAIERAQEPGRGRP